MPANDERSIMDMVAETQTKELATKATFSDQELHEAMTEEMNGLGQIQLPRIKIPAGGTIVFEVPTDDPNEPITVKEVRGVVIGHHPVNRLYLKSVEEQTEANAAPDCYSQDGVTGSATYDPELGYGGLCEKCPMNEFGSGRNGSGKMCSNRHRLLFMMDGGQGFPFVIETPPTSLKTLKTYISNLFLLSKRPSWSVQTALTLKKEQGEKQVYSVLQFRKVADLPMDVAQEMRELGNAMKSIV